MLATSLTALDRLIPASSGLDNFKIPQCWFAGRRECVSGQCIRLRRRQRCVIVCSASKTARKGSGKKKSRKGERVGWDFDRLMLVWDDVFEKCCEDPDRAARLRSIAHEGMRRHGRGCVLVSESVRTVPRGAGSGFSNKSTSDPGGVPAYTSLQWTAEYVPRRFIEDPATAFESNVQVESDAEDFPLVKQSSWLDAVKRMTDRTRLLALTVGNVERTRSMFAEDAGGEAPYKDEDELVLVLSVVIDGNPTVGADVVRECLDTDDKKSWRWKLTLRDFTNL